jgi:hypothetical protein
MRSPRLWPNRDPLKETGHFVLRNLRSAPIGAKELNPYTFLRNSPTYYIDAFGMDEQPWPVNGRVCNRCYDYGDEVYVLVAGKYFTLPPGECTESNPVDSIVDDVDGAWICRGNGECEFWKVGPVGTFNACQPKKPIGCAKWNGDTTSPISPRARSGHNQNNSPPHPKPPVYRPPLKRLPSI